MEDGLYRVTDGTHTAYAAPRPISPVELADMRATAERLAPIANATGGAVRWLAQDGVPDIRRVDPGRASAGQMHGLRANGAYDIQGAVETPLLPPWLALGLLLAVAALTWWREGRRSRFRVRRFQRPHPPAGEEAHPEIQARW